MISRDISTAACRTHDIAIIGGGIYGTSLALEAACRGLRPLLVERGDFGGATSWNSLRILHGGFRYLQTLDVRRFLESAAEQAWFSRTFPELVRPLECLMPLYGRGLRHPLAFTAATEANRLLRWIAARAGHETSAYGARVLDPDETVARFPAVDRQGLLGAGLWHDAVMSSPQRVLMEMLRWACSLGATALNYVEATGLVVRRNRTEGIHVRDVLSGRTHTFASRTVCNCTGPWSAIVASTLDRDMPALFRPSLAFNLLLDREPPSASAVAVAPRRGAGPVYFLYPTSGGVLAGTAHLPWNAAVDLPGPREQDVQTFLDELNAAVPTLALRPAHVKRVLAGFLPTVGRGATRLSTRATMVEHARQGGPAGLISVSGVKFTTARCTARHTLKRLSLVGRTRTGQQTRRPAPFEGVDFYEPEDALRPESLDAVRRLAREESVMTPDDLLLRRTDWGFARDEMDTLRRRVAGALEGIIPQPAGGT